MSGTTHIRGAITGVAFRLESERGTLLGTITIPHHWAGILQERGCVQFAILETPKFFHRDPSPDLPRQMIRTGGLSKSYSPLGGVVLFGVSIEDFEKQDDCSFSPSAAYLRSIME